MTSQFSQGSVPPLEGVIPNFQDPSDQLGANIAVHSIFLFINTLAVIMRFYTRTVINQCGLGIDDCLLLPISI